MLKKHLWGREISQFSTWSLTLLTVDRPAVRFRNLWRIDDIDPLSRNGGVFI
jgi:hypothetical protein